MYTTRCGLIFLTINQNVSDHHNKNKKYTCNKVKIQTVK